jgi:hypothetical protein
MKTLQIEDHAQDRTEWSEGHRIEVLKLLLSPNGERLDKNDDEVVSLAKKQHRKPSSIAIKLKNFRYLDACSESSGIKGMIGFSKADVKCWIKHSNRKLSLRALNLIQEKGWLDLIQNQRPLAEVFSTRLSRSLLAKPFLILAGPSGSGKTREAIELARFLCQPDFRSTIAVGADWTDSRHVVGYLNPLQTADGKPDGAPVYEATEILKLLLHANKHRDLPHFLILDEMNLSHVERYFNDFLSGMELSDKKKALKLHSAGLAKTREGLDVEGCIDFPENLFVIGTVNIDETTYMFSPKVLDRANVLEFRPTITQLKEAAKNLNSDSTKEKIEMAPEQTAKDFLKLAVKAREHSWAAGESLPPEGDWEDFLKNLHEMSQQILEPAGLELTYRPQKEILAYARVDYYFHRNWVAATTSAPDEAADGAETEETESAESEAPEGAGESESEAAGENATASTASGAWDWKRCLDEQIMQKILPKLTGNERKLRDVLGKLREFCEKNLLTEADKARVAEKREREPGDRNLSHAKILQMQRRLETDRFTGYF